MGEIEAVNGVSGGPAPRRGRKKWVTHGLSNRIVYGGLHYGAHWLPMAVLNAINLVGNGLAVTFLTGTKAGMRDNFRTALGVPEAEAESLARQQFFEYGRHTIDVWRLRSEAFVPRITTFEEDARVLAASRRGGRGFLLVTGHVGNWEMGAVTLRDHSLVPAVVGQAELDPNVQEMRQQLRGRLGVESIDIGSSMATAFKVRGAVERGRAVALLVDRAYPEDRALLRLRHPAGVLSAQPRRVLLQRLGRAPLGRHDALARRRRRSDHDPRRGRPRGRGPSLPDPVVQLLQVLGRAAVLTRGRSSPRHAAVITRLPSGQTRRKSRSSRVTSCSTPDFSAARAMRAS
jgi:hypothetical protein